MSHLSILPTVIRDLDLLAASLVDLGCDPSPAGVLEGFAGETTAVDLKVHFSAEQWIGWCRQADGTLALVGDLQRLSRSLPLQTFLGRLTRLDLSEPHSHLVQVSLRCTPTTPVLRLRLPAWTPGSYLIRDYVRHLEGLEVRQGGLRLLPCRTDPAGWRLALPSLEPLEIRYQLLAADLTVRTCHLDGDHGFLALAALALEVEGERWAPHRLSLHLPEGWHPFVPLPRQADGSWLAKDFDQLVDTPV
ncbi:MAG: DUF1257 domain-containing protein, partial [Cyanobacteria bacterium]|nr:DUF1257 domain-containing protein [Cyanobacteriota bacterium]